MFEALAKRMILPKMRWLDPLPFQFTECGKEERTTP